MPLKDRLPMSSESSTELIVALDFARADRAKSFVERLQGMPVIYKVGLELFMSAGPDFVRDLIHKKNRVFLDLKFHDIPNTVARAAKQAALLHVEMFSLHLAGGSAMIRAVLDEFSSIPELAPKILGVNVLTSFDDVRWAEVTKTLTGHAVSAAESAMNLIEQATVWGVNGVVCSALELPEIRRVHPALYTVVPGIRPLGSSINDQARVTTPAQAKEKGASAIVVGRPITEADQPEKVVEMIFKELN